MGIKVVKFGGSSLADASQMRKVANIIKEDSDRRFIVVSAPGKRFSDDIKITDMLYNCYNSKDNSDEFNLCFEKIAERYEGIIKELGLTLDLSGEYEIIKENILKSKTPDYAASRGEYLNAVVFSNFMKCDMLDAAQNIIFDDNGVFDSKTTYSVIKDKLLKSDMVVVPGFYGSYKDGTIKTFSRGGSDITGSILARALNADIYENWTDVSGMLVADPRLVENPKVIDLVTYQELRELSYMGSTVLHEDAVFPVREAGIPINIKNTNVPADKGTFITAELPEGYKKKSITGIAGKQGFSIINVEKDMMNSEVGFGKRLLEVLEKYNVSFDHMVTGIDSLGIIALTSQLKDVKNEISDEILKDLNADVVTIEDNLSLVAVVGLGMMQEKGTAAKVFSALSESGINVKLIDQGYNELNIIVGIDDADYVPALNGIYNKIFK